MPAVVGVYAIFSVLGGLLFGFLYLACRWADGQEHQDALTQAGYLTTALALPIFVITFLVAYLQGVVLSANL
jgi:hypothetical protein